MTPHLRTQPAPTNETRARERRPEPVPDRPGPGFVLYVGVDESFGHGPQALHDLVEAAETLQELARDLLPNSDTHTSLSLTPLPPTTP